MYFSCLAYSQPQITRIYNDTHCGALRWTRTKVRFSGCVRQLPFGVQVYVDNARRYQCVIVIHVCVCACVCEFFIPIGANRSSANTWKGIDKCDTRSHSFDHPKGVRARFMQLPVSDTSTRISDARAIGVRLRFFLVVVLQPAKQLNQLRLRT